MRKLISILTAAAIAAELAGTISVSAESGISVVLNGQRIEFDQQPVIVNDRVLVPLRAIFESMGYDVEWEQSSQIASAKRLNDKLVVGQDNETISYEINGRKGSYLCDVPPRNISGRILVPVRAVAESSRYDVDWNGDTRTVYISNYKNGVYDISFRSDCTDVDEYGIRSDITYNFGYGDDFFNGSSSVYNNDLAVASLGAALSAFSTKQSDQCYEQDITANREDNIIDTYNTLGFAGAEFYNYDKTLNDIADKTAYSFAFKNVTTNTADFTLIPVVIRGGGYGAEWVSNFNLGSGSCHAGFLNAANEVINSLSDYVEILRANGLLKQNVKYWVTGYSRSAAVADIVSAYINNDMQKFYASDVFGYCFATPQWLNKNAESVFNRDYSGIFNIINPGDAIPTVALSTWGYERVGQDIYLNSEKDGDFSEPENIIFDITGNENIKSAVRTVSNLSGVSSFDNTLSGLAASSTEYTEKYQKYIMDISELFCTQYKGNDGENISLSEKFEKKYGKTVESMVSDVDAMLLSLLTPYIGNNYTDTAKCLIALATNDGVEINTQLISFIINFVAYYLVNYTGSNNGDISNNLAYAHYPEVYLSWLMCND
ncbi:MAG: stalk domain-containing protein [Candidatus Ornithomonoglobus sp.]